VTRADREPAADRDGTPFSDRPALWHAALGILAVVGLSVLVGYLGPREEFEWELAAIFGTAAGTTMLAVATY
jgi:hypothetical protein